MTAHRYEVLIVGAGPAGTSAAIHARRAGLSVGLVDRAAFPRDKTCGDGLTTAALRELEAIGLDPARIPSWRTVRSLRVTSPSGRTVDLDLPDDGKEYIAIARRRDLDHRLVDLAVNEGADLHEQTRIVSIEADQGHWVAHSADGDRYEALFVLNASGGRGLAVPTAVGHGRDTGPHDRLLASRVYLNDTADLPDRIHLWFSENTIPGYAWVFPVGEGAANVGVAVHTSNRRSADVVRLTENLLESDWLRRIVGDSARRQGRLRVWPIPSRIRHDPVEGGVYHLGDAAGLSDPMTGEGIAQALTSGRLAAVSIADNTQKPEAAARSYAKQISNLVGADQRTSRMLLKPLGSPRWSRAAIRFMGLSEGLSHWFARWTFEDLPRRAVVSPAALLRSLGSPNGVIFEPPDSGVGSEPLLPVDDRKDHCGSQQPD